MGLKHVLHYYNSRLKFILFFEAFILCLIGGTNLMIPSVNAQSNHIVHVNYHRLPSNFVSEHTFYVSNAKKLHYQSQGHSTACEAASIKNVLSIHDIANHMTLYQLCRTIGWAKNGRGNWNYEYTGNPYKDGSATISPYLIARTLRYYGLNAHVHNYASKRDIINDLKHGMQLIPEAGSNCSYKPYYYHHHWKHPDHILVLVGVKRTRNGILYVQYVDSNHKSKQQGVKWCSFNQFWKSYNRPKYTGDRLVITGYK